MSPPTSCASRASSRPTPRARRSCARSLRPPRPRELLDSVRDLVPALVEWRPPKEDPRAMHGLRDIRVIDFSPGIAGGYATKLLGDAGADVVKVEPPGGDPLRHFTASGRDLDGRDGPLFQFLSAGKRSVIGIPGDAH